MCRPLTWAHWAVPCLLLLVCVALCLASCMRCVVRLFVWFALLLCFVWFFVVFVACVWFAWCECCARGGGGGVQAGIPREIFVFKEGGKIFPW